MAPTDNEHDFRKKPQRAHPSNKVYPVTDIDDGDAYTAGQSSKRDHA
jgi:hypothetical protein